MFPVLEDLVAQINREQVDLVLFGGDNIDNRGTGSEDLATFLSIANQGPAFAAVLGNHEATLRRGCLDKESVAERLSEAGLSRSNFCFSRSVKNVRIVGIDTTLVGSTGGYVNDNVMEFLARELRQADEEHIVVLGHHLVERAWAPHWLDSWDREYLVSNREEVVSLLATNARVRAYLCGHHHASRICRVAGRGHTGGFYQIVTSSPVAFPHTARIVEVREDCLRVQPLIPRLKDLRTIGGQAVLSGRKAERYRVFGDEDDFLSYLSGGEKDQEVLLPHHQRRPPEARFSFG